VTSRTWAYLVAAAAVAAAAAATVLIETGTSGGSPAVAAPQGIHKIRHVVVIMQENRSFDSYFGTYPGADGIPMRDGVPIACVPDPARQTCVRPYHDRNDMNAGGPHDNASAVADIAGGKLNGFVAQQERAKRGCVQAFNPACGRSGKPDVMGYHDGSDIPNYSYGVWTVNRAGVIRPVVCGVGYRRGERIGCRRRLCRDSYARVGAA